MSITSSTESVGLFKVLGQNVDENAIMTKVAYRLMAVEVADRYSTTTQT